MLIKKANYAIEYIKPYITLLNIIGDCHGNEPSNYNI